MGREMVVVMEVVPKDFLKKDQKTRRGQSREGDKGVKG